MNSMIGYNLNPPERNLQTNPLWIGIVGAARAGKDTLADAIGEMYETHTPYLAQPIKDVGMDYYDMTWEDCFTGEGKEREHAYVTFDDGTPMTNRNLLEQIGDKLQELDELVLIRHAEREVQGLEETPRAVMMPDLRTEPQAEFIRDKGGIVVYVQRDVAEGKAESAEGEDAHHTKTFYNRTEWDIKIENNSSLSAFKDRIYFLFGDVLSDVLFGERPDAARGERARLS